MTANDFQAQVLTKLDKIDNMSIDVGVIKEQISTVKEDIHDIKSTNIMQSERITKVETKVENIENGGCGNHPSYKKTTARDTGGGIALGSIITAVCKVVYDKIVSNGGT